MIKGVGSFLLVLCLSVAVPGHAAGGWTLYDDFSSGIINPDKWFGTEGGKTGRETKRIIVSEKLNLSERCYGGTDSNTGGSYSEQTLRITNPSNIRGFRALVKPVKFEAVGCDNNTTYTAWVFARLIGRFFNTDPQSPDSSANDVYAYLVVERDSLSADPEDTARISAKVRRCIDDNCTQYNTLFWKDLGSIEVTVHRNFFQARDFVRDILNSFCYRTLNHFEKYAFSSEHRLYEGPWTAGKPSLSTKPAKIASSRCCSRWMRG